MVENIDSITVYCCGTCSMVFTTEDELREHHDIHGQDGEPSMVARLSVGQRLVWEQFSPFACENVVITRIVRNEDGEVWIFSTGTLGEYPNELDRFVEATRAYDVSSHES